MKILITKVICLSTTLQSVTSVEVEEIPKVFQKNMKITPIVELTSSIKTCLAIRGVCTMVCKTQTIKSETKGEFTFRITVVTDKTASNNVKTRGNHFSVEMLFY